MLSTQEGKYFDDIVESILEGLIVNIPIISYDHETLGGKGKEALGCAWRNGDKVYQITIDEYFIQECYYDYLWNKGIRNEYAMPKIGSQSLEEIICHEIAHIVHWRHGKKHTDLTKRLCSDYRKRVLK